MKLKLIYFLIFCLFVFTKVYSDETYDLRKEVFLNNGNCSTCHTLKDANSMANVGPNLNLIKPDIGRVINSVTNGIGVMPSMLGILSDDEIKAVAYYVSEASMK